MKFASFNIVGYRQFQDLRLDFTDPSTGKPLEKVCFIGSNGTGKTTILRELARHFTDKLGERLEPGVSWADLMEFDRVVDSPAWQQERGNEINGSAALMAITGSGHSADNTLRFASTFDRMPEKIRGILGDKPAGKDWTTAELQGVAGRAGTEFGSRICLGLRESPLPGTALTIFSPPDYGSPHLGASDLPAASLHDALGLFDAFPTFHDLSNGHIDHFWKTLIYHLKKRESDLTKFQRLPENRHRTIDEVDREFTAQNPLILDELAALWNRILDKAGLEFDKARAELPVQLTDNLKAYIKLKGRDTQIPYGELSSGIRHFIFRLGHIFSLYFGREVPSGFLFVDEPEGSLHPDFLYDLVDIYQGVTRNTQMFMATHSPIIAAQFRPEERFILEFNDEGFVSVRRGVSPEGDDPNDLLMQDFAVRSVMGQAGVAKWERFRELRRRIPEEIRPDEKLKLLDEFMSIGNAYNFPVHEISA